MADTKVSALTEDTSPTGDDLVYVVNDPAGVGTGPESRRVTAANLIGSVGVPVFNTATYASVQAAIDAAEAAGGGVVQFDTGTFDVNLTVDSDNVILRGSGYGTVLTSANGTGPIITMTEVDFCGVEHMKLDGEWQSGAAGIEMTGTRWSVFRDLIGDRFIDPMFDMVAAAGQNTNNNSFIHVHAENAVRFVRMSGNAGLTTFCTLNQFFNCSAVGAGTAASTLIDFVRGADNNHFVGVTRLTLGFGSGDIGVVYNSDSPAAIRAVYENHFDDLMIDQDAASTVSMDINDCRVTGSGPHYSHVKLRTGGTNPTAAATIANSFVTWKGVDSHSFNAAVTMTSTLGVTGDVSLSGDIVGDGTGMTITGGDGDGERLSLQSNTADASDTIELLSPPEVYPNGHTFTTAPGSNAVLVTSENTLQMDYANWDLVGVKLGGTVQYNQVPAVFGGVSLFQHLAIHTNESGTAINGAGAFNINYSFMDVMTYRADAAAFSMLQHRGYYTSPTLDVTGAGSPTMTLSSLYGVYSAATIGASSTVTNRYGFFYGPAAVTGTLTNEVGLTIGALNASGNRTAILTGTNTIPSGTWNVYQSGTAVNRWGGAHLLVEQASNPANPTANTEANLYMKGDKLVVSFNQAGTMRYYTLDMAGAASSQWIYSASAP